MAKKLFGLIGHPVRHSLSPAMHNAAFRELGMQAEYDLFDVAPEALEGFLDGIHGRKIAGLNVTIPHKINVKKYLERKGSLDENAKKLGAVNTIKVTESGLCGYNTDGPGFYRSLVEELGFEPEGKNVFVLGSGGAASAVVMYLGNGPKRISIYDVDEAKAASLASHYKKYYDASRLETVSGEAGLAKAIAGADLLVNATPIGMKDGDSSPISKELLHPGLYVYDLVYNRPKTALVKEAGTLKLHASTGLGMLLYQGVIAFEIWTGQKAPVNVMKRALREALKKG